ncbi:peptidylprolyl isomerase [Candidatus Woesearchaeota archaeon]|nr:peptidylprolyl isomerase [Candidatus Woesearchaeota archaeon]
MEKVKKGDFVEIGYTGRLADSGEVFDTTSEKVAKENKIWSKDETFGNKVICLGENQILNGIDANLVGKEPGSEYTFTLSPEEAFGKKDTKLIQLISTARFRKEGIEPEVGLQINIDGVMGTIRSVTGGRTLVDFNHPLSGKDVAYTVDLVKVIDQSEDKIRAIIKNELNQDADVKVVEKSAIVTLKKKLQKEIENVLAERIKSLVPDITNIRFQ